jgi:hypothetical protein
MRLCENDVLRICRPDRDKEGGSYRKLRKKEHCDKVTGGEKKLHNEKFRETDSSAGPVEQGRGRRGLSNAWRGSKGLKGQSTRKT